MGELVSNNEIDSGAKADDIWGMIKDTFSKEDSSHVGIAQKEIKEITERSEIILNSTKEPNSNDGIDRYDKADNFWGMITDNPSISETTFKEDNEDTTENVIMKVNDVEQIEKVDASVDDSSDTINRDNTSEKGVINEDVGGNIINIMNTDDIEKEAELENKDKIFNNISINNTQYKEELNTDESKILDTKNDYIKQEKEGNEDNEIDSQNVDHNEKYKVDMNDVVDKGSKAQEKVKPNDENKIDEISKKRGYNLRRKRGELIDDDKKEDKSKNPWGIELKNHSRSVKFSNVKVTDKESESKKESELASKTKVFLTKLKEKDIDTELQKRQKREQEIKEEKDK